MAYEANLELHLTYTVKEGRSKLAPARALTAAVLAKIPAPKAGATEAIAPAKTG